MAAAQPGCICVDGRLLAPHEATVSALDAGFLLGDGLFESLRASGGVPYLLDRHLARLYGAARELEFACMPSHDALSELVHETLESAALEDAYVRVTVTRGRGVTALAAPNGPPTVVIAALPAPPRPNRDGGIAAALIDAPCERALKAKSTSRQSAVLARRKAALAGAEEGIYVSERGRVLEGSSANVFVVSGGRVLTPPVEDCLPGITRRRLIELAQDDGLDALEVPLSVEELLAADEVFVTNAVQGLRAIRTIDGQAVGIGGKGGVFGKERVLTGKEKEGVFERGVFARLSALYEADRAAVIRSAQSGPVQARSGEV